MKELQYPIDADYINRKVKSIKRQLLSDNSASIEKRIAVLGGSTTANFIDCLEVFLLDCGIAPRFYESEYNKYYEDAVFGNPELDEFQPEIVIVYTTNCNLLYDSSDKEKYIQIAESLQTRYNCVVIQNNFDYPQVRSMGPGELMDSNGKIRYINKLNLELLEYSDEHKGYYVHDINTLSASLGLDRWHNRVQYYSYKIAIATAVIPYVSYNVCRLVRSILGKSKKCLVTDLDNTLWGGVIGDVGVDGIALGHETPKAQSYFEVQQYLLDLKKRGVILAVCSKNDEVNAKRGFAHPDSVLKVDDFAVFVANWENKDRNLAYIAKELNIGIDSLVFLDDNPAEREIVRQSLPEVTVLEVDAANPYTYIQAIADSGVFDTISVSDDDLKRSANYEKKSKEKELEKLAVSYDDFLESLEMKAEIKAFEPVYYERISQLTNKSNQFNLTTLRCTIADITKFSEDDKYITLYGRLTDKFGDNGLVSVVVAERTKDDEADIILWLMSCRVLKRNMEYEMFNQLVQQCMNKGIKKLNGFYYPTAKNTMVEDFYDKLGFCEECKNSDKTVYRIILSENCVIKNTHIS